MTVSATLSDGRTDNYMRFGDAYVKHHDGTLDVLRSGAKQPHRYGSASGPTSKVTKRGSRTVSGVNQHHWAEPNSGRRRQWLA